MSKDAWSHGLGYKRLVKKALKNEQSMPTKTMEWPDKRTIKLLKYVMAWAEIL